LSHEHKFTVQYHMQTNPTCKGSAGSSVITGVQVSTVSRHASAHLARNGNDSGLLRRIVAGYPCSQPF
jgi:hypothetical protein